MAAAVQPAFLLASTSQALVATLEPLLEHAGAQLRVETSAPAALSAMLGAPPPTLAMVDADLPGMPVGQLLATVHAEPEPRRFPLVVVAGEISPEWIDRLQEGVIDDLIPRAVPPLYWQLCLDRSLRSFTHLRELEQLRQCEARHAETDALTGIYNRAALLSMLFRETDRVQRMHTSLSMIVFDLDDFGHWNSRLGSALCDDLLVQVTERVGRLLRTYDLFGRVGNDEFLLGLPGCSPVNAVLLAERIRSEVFAVPFHVALHSIRLSACFGIAASHGRSPVVVLRDAEQALQQAKTAGPESIVPASNPQPQSPPVAFLSPTSGDELLAW